MTEIVRMVSVEPVLFGVVKIVWRDGYQSVVDLRPVIGDRDIFAFLRGSADRFSDVVIDEHGHRLFWIDDNGDEVDLGSESLRVRSERQDALLRVAG